MSFKTTTNPAPYAMTRICLCYFWCLTSREEGAPYCFPPSCFIITKWRAKHSLIELCIVYLCALMCDHGNLAIFTDVLKDVCVVEGFSSWGMRWSRLVIVPQLIMARWPYIYIYTHIHFSLVCGNERQSAFWSAILLNSGWKSIENKRVTRHKSVKWILGCEWWCSLSIIHALAGLMPISIVTTCRIHWVHFATGVINTTLNLVSAKKIRTHLVCL